jgi:hypothetical protein
MHLFGHGLAHHLIDMVGGSKYKAADYSKGDLFLGHAAITKLFDGMEESLPLIPTSFKGSFRKPFGQNTTRAVDWVDIARYVISALFISKFKDPDTKTAVISIVKFLQLSLQPTITPTQLTRMKRLPIIS